MFYLLPCVIYDRGQPALHDNAVDINGLKVGDRYPTRVMGVINLSPESFYKDSVHDSAEEVVDTVIQMVNNGADLIDIGGASSAPREVYGTEGVDVETELERVKAVLQHLDGRIRVPISVDTTSSRVAEMALKLGADAVNDTTGFQGDPEMASVVSEYSAPAILMAHCSPPCNAVSASIGSLMRSLEIAEGESVDYDHIILDPSIGFGKPAEVDLRLLRSLNRFRVLGRPLLVGVSRKSFVGEVLNQEHPEDRLIGSLAATAIAVSKGVSVVRTHDVRESWLLLKMSDEIRGEVEVHSGRAALVDVDDELGIELLLNRVGVREGIRRALAKKGIMLTILLRDIPASGALILKQEMLALGGDAAYHHDTIDFERKTTDVLLMGTTAQIGRLSSKTRNMDYFGLPEIAEDIEMLLKERAKELNEG
jgi:dihydropteroate synthase